MKTYLVEVFFLNIENHYLFYSFLVFLNFIMDSLHIKKRDLNA